MTRAEIVAVVTLAGPEAERRLPFAERRTRRGIAVHEAAHSIAALRFGVPVHRVTVEVDHGSTEYAENAGEATAIEDSERARLVGLLALPDAEPSGIALWVSEMRRRAFGVVDKHWDSILALADVLDARGELSREEVLTATRGSLKDPSGPSSPPRAAGVAIAR